MKTYRVIVELITEITLNAESKAKTEQMAMKALSKQPDICSAHVIAVCPVKEAEK